jgi:hypothetical protein
MGVGTNPVTNFIFSHEPGTSGIASVVVPNLIVSGNATFSGIIYDNNGLAGTAGQVLTSTSSGVVWAAGGGGGGAVASVSNSDGTLTISPTTGAVVASLNLGHLNTWTARQTFPSVVVIGSSLFEGQCTFAGTGASGGITITGSLTDSFGSEGTIGQLLSATGIGPGVEWVNSPGASFGTAGHGGFFGPGLCEMGHSWADNAQSSTICNTNNQVTVRQFILQSSFTLGHCSAYCMSAVGTETFDFGIYSASGNLLIDAGGFSANTTALQTLSFTSVTLPPGVYYFAQTMSDASQQVLGVGNSATELSLMDNLLNALSPRVAIAANPATGSGTMPATLGTLTASTVGGTGIPFWEP